MFKNDGSVYILSNIKYGVHYIALNTGKSCIWRLLIRRRGVFRGSKGE
jgi:hypothetical protein